MKSGTPFAIVLVTAPDLRTARMLGRAALKARLAACVNILKGIESHYWWQGRIEKGAETLLILKTARQRLASLQKLVMSLHPYDTPEFLVLEVSGGNRRYLDWLGMSVRAE
jgi:periplasmic divalent cation tolerance protein